MDTIISIISLILPYLSFGRLRMTRPTVIAFAFEGIRKEPKIFLRTLLRSNGIVVENIFLKVKHSESTVAFSVWAYGSKDGLVRGSGIYVGKEGIEDNHHFLLPKSEKGYKFLPGRYDIETYAVVKDKKRKLNELTLEVSEEMAKALKESRDVMFDWNPETKSYESHVRELSPAELAYLLMSP